MWTSASCASSPPSWTSHPWYCICPACFTSDHASFVSEMSTVLVLLSHTMGYLLDVQRRTTWPGLTFTTCWNTSTCATRAS
eukprot:2558800-Pyramimonas_sp.AAC.1